MKNRKTAIIALVVVLVILFGAGVYLIASQRSNKTPELIGQELEIVPTIPASDIGLELVAKSDKKYVKFTINKPEGIDKVDYEITYDATAPEDTSGEGGGEGKVTQSLTGTLLKKDMKNGKLGIDYRELGTCSTGGKCRFDQGVTSVKVIVKITKSNGKAFQAETSIDL
ncbi:hypothetical protein M1349_03315 [Patescibacteria group bacterium]|nr:hypothetical protein [Patescibacteria group bacterium]